MGYKTIVSHLSKILHVPESEITPESSLRDLGLDSLDMIDLLLYVEKEYKVSIPDEFVMKTKTIKDLVVIADKLELAQ